MQTRPTLSGTTVVILGHFNPLIFRPGWFSKVGFLSQEDENSANQNTDIVHRDIVIFNTDWLQFSVDNQRLQATSSDDPTIRLFDFIVGTFTRLRDTPIRAFGINHNFHFQMADQKRWYALEDKLAPKDLWGEFVISESGRRKGGLRTLVIQQDRDPPESGYTRVMVEPSTKINNGVYIDINEHYRMQPNEDDNKEDVAGNEAMESFSEVWEKCSERVFPICDLVLRC